MAKWKLTKTGPSSVVGDAIREGLHNAVKSEHDADGWEGTNGGHASRVGDIVQRIGRVLQDRFAALEAADFAERRAEAEKLALETGTAWEPPTAPRDPPHVVGECHGEITPEGIDLHFHVELEETE